MRCREVPEFLGQLAGGDARPRRVPGFAGAVAVIHGNTAVRRGLLVDAAHGAHIGVFQIRGRGFPALGQHLLAQGGGRVGGQHQTQTAALDQGVLHAGAHAPAGQGLAVPPAALPAPLVRGAAQQTPPALGPSGQILRRPGKKHLARVQHDHAGTARGLVQIGGGPDHGHAAVAQFLHHAPEFTARLRVHAHARLVQQKQARRAQQGAGNAQLLLHAAGKPPGQPFGERSQRGKVQQPGKKFVPGLAREPAQAGVQAQIRHDREIFIQAEALGHVADAVGLAPGQLHGRAAEHQSPAAGGLHQAGQNADQGGLARRVRPHQSGDPPGGNTRVDAFKRFHRRCALAETHAQIFQAHRDAGFVRPRLFRRGGPDGGPHGVTGSRVMVTGMPWRMTFSGSSTWTRRR